MPPAPNRRGIAERRYGFVGSDVKSTEDLTPAHIRYVYFLQTTNPAESLPDSIKEVLLPYCGNKYLESKKESTDATTSTTTTCTAARCKEGNPHCLNHLGQEQWEKEDAVDTYCFPRGKKGRPIHQSRLDGFPVGLKNLGATCYANASLQVWFHDPAFRDCIYRCEPKAYVDVSKDALHQLQMLFAYMDKGQKSFCSPLSLVECLGLNTKTEQDAQEFGSLLMSKIENELQQQDDPQLRTFIKSHFQGSYNYSTICKKCKTTSIRPCTFYELRLNIEDNWSLKDCLNDFLKPENLVGDDKYSCDVCQSLQNATRKTEMETMPEVLNMQLMRFKFDTKTWIKEKSFEKVTFPETMDMADLVGSDESLLYDLSAVLVHSGDTLETGHYLTYVQHPESKKWFVCNDEAVLEFDSKKFDPANYAEPKKPKTKGGKQQQKAVAEIIEVTDPSNIFSSSNAYMLSYTKRATKRDLDSVAPPSAALEDVIKDNEVYTKEVDACKAVEKTLVDEFEKHRTELRELYRVWHVESDGTKGYYVPQELLMNLLAMKTGSKDQKWTKIEKSSSSLLSKNTGESSSSSLSSPSSSSSSTSSPSSATSATPTTPTPPDPPAQITCMHGKLCPKAVLRSKRVSEEGYSILTKMGVVDHYPTLTPDDLCTKCTTDQVQDRLYAIEHKRDVDEFERKLKLKGPKNVAVNWISKAWVADWCKVMPRFHKEATGTKEDDGPISEAYLSDVICLHSGLAADKTKRRLISDAALMILEKIFGPLELPTNNTVECVECHDGLQPLLDDRKDTAVRASAEKQELSEVLIRGSRVEDMVPLITYYIVPQAFMKQWMDYVKRPASSKRPETIDSEVLMCEHGLFTYDLETKADYEDETGIFVLLDTEWETFCSLYEGGKEIVYVKQPASSSPLKIEGKTETDEYMTPTLPKSTPTCQECRSKRILNFTSANIFVRVYPPGETTILPIEVDPTSISTSLPSSSPPAANGSGSMSAEESAKDSKPNSSSSNDNKGSPKRKALPSSSFASDMGSRRSKRYRPAKGPFTEHRVQVTKFDTIMDLKIKIMNKTSIVPLYQKLMMGEYELDENERTIEGLGIAPNTVLNLITFDENSEEAKQRLLQDAERSGPGGFTGTGLTGDWS
ncbi:hypothetical protein BGZ83_006323 [Gryganskiella cystojenkinii]|nr:hypothetical protein BGZ83_006323 [Gryganskiella cystojenkinii]